MQIRKSTLQDLQEIEQLYADARDFMRENGNPTQWGEHYPPIDLIKDDIENQVSYVCVEKDEIVATFFYQKRMDDSTYHVIENGNWISDEEYGVIHRITAKRGTKGVASYCITQCYKECGHLRMDTHENNIPMQRLLEKLGFQKCGIIYVANGSPRIAYEWI